MSQTVLGFILTTPVRVPIDVRLEPHACRMEHAGLDESASAMEVVAMDAVKVDREGRIWLQILKPGDYYEPAFVSPDVITLRRVAASESQTRLSADAVKQAIRGSTLDFGAGYDEVSALTREP